MSSTHGHQQEDGRERRRATARAHDLAAEQEGEGSPFGVHRSPQRSSRNPHEEDSEEEPLESATSRRPQRGAHDLSTSVSSPHSGQLSARQLAEDGNELRSRSSLRRSRHDVLGAPPARYEAHPSEGLLGNISFANHDKAHTSTDDLLNALGDADPHAQASSRRQRDELSRSPALRLPSHHREAERIPSKPTWADYLGEVRHVAKTRHALPNWDSKFTASGLRTLFDGMNAAGRRGVLSRLRGSERELPALEDVWPAALSSEKAGRPGRDEGSPRSPRSSRPESRADRRLASRRSRLFLPGDASPAPAYAEPPRAPSPPTAPYSAYAVPTRMVGAQYATSFEDLMRAERERLKADVQPGLHDFGGLADALEDVPTPSYHPRAREGELRRQVLVRRAGE